MKAGFYSLFKSVIDLSYSSSNIKEYFHNTSKSSDKTGHVKFRGNNNLSENDKAYIDGLHFMNAVPKLVKNVVIGAINYAKGKNIIDYHLVDQGDDAYLKQNNVKNLIYNFGRQDCNIND